MSSQQMIPMTRSQFLAWNDNWDSRDKALLEADLHALGAVRFERYESATDFRKHVDVYNADDVLVMQVSRGTVYYAAAAGRSPATVRLSTHTAGGRGGKAAVEPVACSQCHLVHPPSIGCDEW